MLGLGWQHWKKWDVEWCLERVTIQFWADNITVFANAGSELQVVLDMITQAPGDGHVGWKAKRLEVLWADNVGDSQRTPISVGAADGKRHFLKPVDKLRVLGEFLDGRRGAQLAKVGRLVAALRGYHLHRTHLQRKVALTKDIACVCWLGGRGSGLLRRVRAIHLRLSHRGEELGGRAFACSAALEEGTRGDPCQVHEPHIQALAAVVPRQPSGEGAR